MHIVELVEKAINVIKEKYQNSISELSEEDKIKIYNKYLSDLEFEKKVLNF